MQQSLKPLCAQCLTEKEGLAIRSSRKYTALFNICVFLGQQIARPLAWYIIDFEEIKLYWNNWNWILKVIPTWMRGELCREKQFWYLQYVVSMPTFFVIANYIWYILKWRYQALRIFCSAYAGKTSPEIICEHRHKMPWWGFYCWT